MTCFEIFSQCQKKLKAEPLICITISKNLWSDSHLCPTVPKRSWRESQVCLTMSKDLWGELQFCHTVLKKIVALITILSHDDNIFVSCNKVLFRSVNNSERGIKTMFIVHSVESFVSKFKNLFHSARNFASRITFLSNGVTKFVICTTVLSLFFKTLCPQSVFCLKVTNFLWIALKFCLTVSKFLKGELQN